MKLLASNSSISTTDGLLVDLSDQSKQDKDTSKDGGAEDEQGNEIHVLREKLQRFEGLLLKCKENIKTQKDRIAHLQAENETVRANEAKKVEEIDYLHVFGVLVF